MSNGDASLLLASPGPDPTRYPPDPPIAISSQEQAWQRFITRTVPSDELPSLIETIFSGRESDAQVFIDTMDEVHHHTLYFRGMADLLSSLLRSFVQALNELDLASRI